MICPILGRKTDDLSPLEVCYNQTLRHPLVHIWLTQKNDLPFYVKLKYDDTVDGRNPAPVDR